MVDLDWYIFNKHIMPIGDEGKECAFLLPLFKYSLLS